jgi:hypothetical protein
MGLSTAPLKNECAKTPGMTAPDGRGSKEQSGGQRVFIHLDGAQAHGTPCGHGSVTDEGKVGCWSAGSLFGVVFYCGSCA